MMGAYWRLDRVRRILTRRPIRTIVLYALAGLVFVLSLSVVQDTFGCPAAAFEDPRQRYACQGPWGAAPAILGQVWLAVGFLMVGGLAANIGMKRLRRDSTMQGLATDPSRMQGPPAWYELEANARTLVGIGWGAILVATPATTLAIIMGFLFNADVSDVGRYHMVAAWYGVAALVLIASASLFLRLGRRVREEARRANASETTLAPH